MESVPHDRLLHRSALGLAVCTFFLVCAGALVTSRGAGLAVPDWPLSYGHFIVVPLDWMKIPNFRAEHGHRVIAGTVALLTIGLTVLFARREKRSIVRKFMYLALGSVFLQALLGGLTVKFLLPLPISASHAMLGQTFFCLLVGLAVATSRSWLAPSPHLRDPEGISTPSLALFFVLVVYMQLLLGALMRHSESGLAILDFPLSYGRLIPATNEIALHNINVERLEWQLPRVEAWQIWLHFAHRAWAIMVCAAAGLVALRIFKAHRDCAALLFPIMAIVLLIVIQIGLGGMVILTGKQPHIATAHVGVGALILAISVVLWLHAQRIFVWSRASLPANSAQVSSLSREAHT